MKQFRTLGIALLAGMLLVVGGTPALAAGTDAGLTISNTASLTYDVGGVGQGPVSSTPATFTVDNKVDLTMTGGNNASASGAGNVLVFTLENTGNEDQGYALQLFTGANGSDDDFNMSDGATANAVKVYIDVNKDGAVDVGDTDITASLGTGSNIADVLANAGAASTIQLLIVGDVPSGTANGLTAAYTLKATTLDVGTNTVTTATAGANTLGGAPDVVLADGDAGSGVNGSSDGANNGQYLATGTYTVSTAQLSITKGVAVISDPVNGGTNPKAIPGATVRYTITITNSGAADATSVVMSDPIPSNTDFVVGSVTDDSATGTVTYSNDNGTTWTYSPSGVTDPAVTNVRVSIPTVNQSGGAIDQVIITFDVVIE